VNDQTWRHENLDARPRLRRLFTVTDFAAHLASCRAQGALPEHDEDLRLAWEAARGDTAAQRRLEAQVAPEIAAAARRVDGDPAFVDEVRQAVRVRLFVGEPARIGAYAGRGPLRGWVAVAAARIALNLKRDARHPPPAADVLAELVAAETDPELRHLKIAYGGEFRAALDEALRALPDRQRALLRLSLVDGLRSPQLAKLYGVHETTALRWLQAATEAVADGARKRLVERLAISPESVDSLGRAILSQLDLSIARILGDRTG